MISVNNIAVIFGGFTLFENVSFLINSKDRIGLAGKNGAGKSTMLKLLAGLQTPTKGEISKPKICKVAYLPQDMIHQHGRTVFEEAETAFEEIKQMQARMDEISHQLTIRTDYESVEYLNLIQELTDISAKLDVLGASNTSEEIEKVLKGLGFERKDFIKQTSEYSGGWRMRIELAKLLLQKPDVLLLDEPTNHLDIEAIIWLEEFLETFSGAVVLISHDRTFLDNVTSRTIEIVNQKIYDYKTNYSRYLILREERIEQQEKAAKNQQKIIDHTEALIDKYRAKANKAAFAQSLIKKLDRMERVEVDDVDGAAVRFRFPAPTHSGKIVITAEHVGKQYDTKEIFKDANFIITKGEKIGFVGRNGEGKTTMMKIIAGKVPFNGKMQLGHNVLMGYFEQDQEEKLNQDKTVFDTIDELAVGDIRKQVRGLLGSFLFSGEDIDKKVKVLSGGERGRLALCKLLLQPYNLLLLDEPTNHLDIKSKEVLKNALLEYEGTVIMVSHDRDFMKGLCNRLYEFKDGKVKEHLCDIAEFMELRKIEKLQELNLKNKEVKKEIVQKSSAAQTDTAKSPTSKIKKMESEIEAIEQRINEMEQQLAVPENYDNLMNNKDFFNEYTNLKNTIEQKLKEWEKLISS